MRLRLDFGLDKRREVSWTGDVSSFPNAIEFEGVKYEWFMYQKDNSGHYEYILKFSPMKAHDTRWYWCVDFKERFENSWGSRKNNGCECGAVHTSFPQVHMFYCPEFKKIEVL